MAWGGYAVAPISVGAFSVGLVAIGNFSVGLFSFGTVALGWLVLGCASIGYDAFAWLSAMGWDTAQSGGFGLAGHAAWAPVAFAEHANNDAARAILASPGTPQYQMAFITVVTLLSLVPVIFYARAVRKRMGKG
jgi:hypothetical protein